MGVLSKVGPFSYNLWRVYAGSLGIEITFGSGPECTSLRRLFLSILSTKSQSKKERRRQSVGFA